jgi:hypothetical protein
LPRYLIKVKELSVVSDGDIQIMNVIAFKINFDSNGFLFHPDIAMIVDSLGQ